MVTDGQWCYQKKEHHSDVLFVYYILKKKKGTCILIANS
jgi:hypothetical protein